MFHLHHADALAPLLDALAEALAPPPADPFTPDVVAVPAAGLRDAAMVGLGRRLGESAPGAGDGISANVEFVFPERFMARALGGPTRSDDVEADPWRLPRLAWAVLEELSAGSVVVPGVDHSTPWSLARRIADLFDRYATQRPRLIQQWAEGVAGDGTHRDDGSPSPLDPAQWWQLELWQAVRARIGTPSPPEQLSALLEAIRSGGVQPQLPERVAVFGVGAIAPVMQQVLQALAEQREVHVFLRHPSMGAWRSSPHQLAGGLNVRANLDVTIAVSNPLLASWGRPALEARALLHGLAPVTEHAHGVATVEPPATVLQALQRAVRLDIRPEPSGLSATDGSFQVHACHGDVRQLEVLRDALGHAFVADPSLQPHEVLVLCPDLERFAPLIEAVFARGALRVPVRVGDRSLTTEEPVVVALQALLGLVSGRATLSEVLALVQFEPVRRRFGWSIEQVEQIAEWADSLGARWGLTAEHRMEWGLPGDIATGTWRITVDQLLAGMAMDATTPRLVLGGVSPYDDVSTNEFELVGSLADLLARLLDLHQAVRHDRPIADWVELLHAVVDDFCADDPDEPWHCQSVHRELTDIARAASSPVAPDTTAAVPLSLPEVRALLADSLSDRSGRLPLRSGAVTVSSLVPQHGVPARVICLLGLDDGALRGGTFDGDDVLGVRPCVGERHPRHESRQLLLDALLGAGERLLVTCNGADLTTNKEVPFSVPLVELLDAVRSVVELTPRHQPVVVRHPRHGFDDRSLLPGALVPGSGVPFTFDPEMLAAAEARRRAVAAPPAPPSSPWLLEPVPLGTVALDTLVDAMVNPSRVYLRQRLELRVPDEPTELDDGLAVGLEPLVSSSLGRSLLDARRHDGSPEEWTAAARLNGALPPGELSTGVLADIRSEVGLVEALAIEWKVPLIGGEEIAIDQALPVSLHDGATTVSVALQGVVRGVGIDGHRHLIPDVRFNRPNPGLQLAVAIRVAAAQRQRPDVPFTGVLLSRGKTNGKAEAVGLQIRGAGAEQQANAEHLLATAVQLLEWATRDAVPLFPRASHALAAGDLNLMFARLESDMLDRLLQLLWPELGGESLLQDPLLPTDPSVLRGRGSSRAAAVANWVWDTFAEVVQLVDSAGMPVGDAGASQGGDDA